MKGTRLADDTIPQNPGEYSLYKGAVFAMLPNGDNCHLRTWTHEFHEDGTISTHPSINSLARDGSSRWHGYLRAGEFVAV